MITIFLKISTITPLQRFLSADLCCPQSIDLRFIHLPHLFCGPPFIIPSKIIAYHLPTFDRPSLMNFVFRALSWCHLLIEELVFTTLDESYCLPSHLFLASFNLGASFFPFILFQVPLLLHTYCILTSWSNRIKKNLFQRQAITTITDFLLL